jgi:hypothetical protein
MGNKVRPPAISISMAVCWCDTKRITQCNMFRAITEASVLGEVRLNVGVLVLGSTSMHECGSTGTREY